MPTYFFVNYEVIPGCELYSYNSITLRNANQIRRDTNFFFYLELKHNGIEINDWT